jgi:1-acyl-sn-glycerol-3-phosphate acyltransferase
VLYHILRIVLYPFCWLLFRVRVTGKQNIPKGGGYIICPNHVSMIDVFVLLIAFNCHIRYMGKEELFKNPILGALIKALGGFAVKRGKGDMEAIETACKVLESGGVFGIFPEGTRSPDGKPAKAKTGAAMISMKTKAPLLPVSIRYSTGKAKLFCKTTINIGEAIAYKEPEEGETLRSELRRITEALMNSIIKLWEMKA